MTEPSGLCSADMDNDGDLDLVIASYNKHQIAWYETLPGNEYKIHMLDTLADGVQAIAVADLDDDGDMDVVSGCCWDWKVNWHENNGAGVFTKHLVSHKAPNCKSVAIADLDDDGDKDILAAIWDHETIAWYENDGSFNFTMHKVDKDLQSAKGVAAADIDGDGLLDIISCARDTRKVSWYKNEGDGDFADRYVFSTQGEHPRDMALDDFDGDGDIDVLVGASDDRNLILCENNGTGHFTVHDLSSGLRFIINVASSDLDGDGDPDIVASCYDTGIYWYENQGNLQFSSHRLIDTNRHGGPVAVGDFNGDNETDIVSTGGGLIYFHQKVSDSSYQTRNIPECVRDPAMVYGINWDDDSALEVAVLSRDSHTLTVKDPYTDEAFTLEIPYDFYFSRAVDMDFDGDVDILIPIYDDYALVRTNFVGWIENQGAMSATFHVLDIVQERPSISMAVDVDNDGDMDFMGSYWNGGEPYSGTLVCYRNDGAGQYERVELYSATETPTKDYFVDLDGDGYKDILGRGQENGQGIVALYNDIENGRFVARTLGITPTRIRSLHHLDLENDGDIDFVGDLFGMYYESTDSYHGNSLFYMLNKGDGSYQASWITPEFVNPKGVDVGDIDRDGLEDFVAYSDDEGLSWFRNDGSYNFSEHEITGSELEIDTFVLEDVDQDGDVDIILADDKNCYVAWLENRLVVSSVEEGHSAVVKFVLHNNYPNPFNPETKIPVDLEQAAHVMLKVYNSLGREVAVLIDRTLSAGHYEETFESNGFPSGVYFYQLTVGDCVKSKKMLLVK